MRGGCWPAFEKSEFGWCCMLGGMTVIELLAFAMRQSRGCETAL